MKDLESLRKNIDKVDKKIAKLLSKRFDIVNEIAKIKKQNDIEIENLNREKVVLENVACGVELDKQENVKKIYNIILTESKNFQRDKNSKWWNIV